LTIKSFAQPLRLRGAQRQKFHLLVINFRDEDTEVLTLPMSSSHYIFYLFFAKTAPAFTAISFLVRSGAGIRVEHHLLRVIAKSDGVDSADCWPATAQNFNDMRYLPVKSEAPK